VFPVNLRATVNVRVTFGGPRAKCPAGSIVDAFDLQSKRSCGASNNSKLLSRGFRFACVDGLASLRADSPVQKLEKQCRPSDGGLRDLR